MESAADALRAGACVAWELPGDRMVRHARRIVSDVVSGLGVPEDFVHTATVAVSELATNALVHGSAHAALESGPPVTGLPELWLYVRGTALPRELVLSVFDMGLGASWSAATVPAVGVPDAESESGRGLQILGALAEESQGRWGMHPSRAPLGAYRLPGTAAWLALPLPSEIRAGPAFRDISPAEAIESLASHLRHRGIDGDELQARVNGRAARLSVRHLTVWALNGAYRWCGASGPRRRPLADVVDATDQILAETELARRRSEMEG
ncbi:ATP-binding protein [Actinoallomurus vinaceus]